MRRQVAPALPDDDIKGVAVTYRMVVPVTMFDIVAGALGRSVLNTKARLMQITMTQFHDAANGGFFQTGVDHEQLVARRKDLVDNAIPSGNSLMAENLLRLATLLDKPDYRREAGRILLMLKDAMANQPTGFGRLLCALDAYLAPSQEIAIVGDPADAGTQALLAVVRDVYLPHTVIAGKRAGEESMLPLLQGRDLVRGRPAAYVCENYACRLPVTEAVELEKMLSG